MPENHNNSHGDSRSSSSSSRKSDVRPLIDIDENNAQVQSVTNSESTAIENEDSGSSSSARNGDVAGALSSRKDHRQLLPDLEVDPNLHELEVEADLEEIEQIEAEEKDKPISWSSLPRKDQLTVLVLSRLSEPLTQTALGSYIFYQLQSFDPSLPESTIAYQVGIIHASFPAAQFLTAILWGRFADSPHGGRKRVIFIGLLGTMLSMLGFGFSHSFPMAVVFRCLGGTLNGNIGTMRTMVSEIVVEKKYQSRAFLLLPMTFNIGVIIGPILGGLLADPVGSYPSVFGPGSPLGGKDGVYWMTKWPYALPTVVNAAFLLFSSFMVLLFLEETSELTKHKPDPGLRIGRWIRRHILRQNIPDEGYVAIPTDEDDADAELQQTPVSGNPTSNPFQKAKIRNILPFRRIWTRNMTGNLVSRAVMSIHVGTFNSLWFTYLSTPRYDPKNPYPPGFKPHGLIHFTGGLALPPPRIGLALSILGCIGISLQLFIYPRLSHKLGAARSYKIFLALCPLAYALTPFLSIVPSWSSPPAGVTGPFIWIAICSVLFVQTLARTFALPSSAILINNSSPHPSVLGTVHGIAQTVGSLSGTFGPIMFGWTYGKGLNMGVVGLAWWCLALVAVVGSVAARFIYEGDGHEILMEGEVRGEDGVVRTVG
ncbi:MFS general substrate transporter [Aaosphaeria arxii CBS 175.79]|uniref:MFS general substrate transporter n=1 Tax=Aaosphaeria arxii CBS 175.79 TaxID=1450172 RepID=A0A6A5X9F5_9PLEO|nr:MFS general substrate transporter [Aaosphaeria arxii CBS 175.79]KAF2009516.1 MFS general substrate transporter [Aaosphaeria arxii CBS 175.79]